jgi:DNA-binding XRE family transcriptional regulator
MQDPENVVKLAYSKHSLNRRQVAEFVGTHVQTIYKWEVGERDPSASAVCLFECLDVLMESRKGREFVRGKIGATA